ncbi:HAD family hydrolase [Bosea sp. 117]|uniref:HAD family hydrolase n=1 Tax=Bosea sp. 117 TaxID=1125973 RepID=UPI0004940F8D|nr:HAD family hydrolase [Bosea sp. 117]
MSFDLVIFDCDGVLVDSELISCRCLIDTLRGYGIETTFEEVFATFLGRSTTTIAEHYRAAGLRIPDNFQAELKTRVRQAFAAELRPIANIETVLRRLAAVYCVASSSDLDRVEFSLELTGLSDLFSGRIFTAQMVANGKPAPDLFLYAAARMGAAQDRTLVIEDSVSGVQAAKAAGMTAWGFVGGSHYAARDGRALLIEAGADRVFERMSDFRRQQAAG